MAGFTFVMLGVVCLGWNTPGVLSGQAQKVSVVRFKEAGQFLDVVRVSVQALPSPHYARIPGFALLEKPQHRATILLSPRLGMRPKWQMLPVTSSRSWNMAAAAICSRRRGGCCRAALDRRGSCRRLGRPRDRRAGSSPPEAHVARCCAGDVLWQLSGTRLRTAPRRSRRL